MASEYQCPFCRSIIALQDVNVATDVALCRACGQSAPFSAVNGMAGFRLDEFNQPPRWTRVEEEIGGGTTIIYRRPSPALIFLVPFTAFWSGGFVFVSIKHLKESGFNPHQLFFALPFIIGSIALLGIITFLLLGKWRITLRHGRGMVSVGVAIFRWTRYFDYNRATMVGLRPTNVQVNNVNQLGVWVQTDGEEFVFGSLITEDAKKFIAATILNAKAKV